MSLGLLTQTWVEIASKGDKVSDPDKRKLFFEEELYKFQRHNSGEEAEKIIKLFETKIKICETLIQAKSHDKGNEPSNMVKGWIVYFEKSNSETVMQAISRIMKGKEWIGSPNTIKNKYDIVIRIVNGKNHATNQQKRDLFSAISMLNGEKKSKAEAQYFNLR
jgi:hypothetical protein